MRQTVPASPLPGDAGVASWLVIAPGRVAPRLYVCALHHMQYCMLVFRALSSPHPLSVYGDLSVH